MFVASDMEAHAFNPSTQEAEAGDMSSSTQTDPATI